MARRSNFDPGLSQRGLFAKELFPWEWFDVSLDVPGVSTLAGLTPDSLNTAPFDCAPWEGHAGGTSATRSLNITSGVAGPTIGTDTYNGYTPAIWAAIFDPTMVTSGTMRAWWHGDHVGLVNSGSNVGSWTPWKGTSAADSTYVLANSDGTFATVPLYEAPDSNFAIPQNSMGTAGDEVRFLENTAFSTPISQPVTIFLVYFTFNNTNNTYFLLNASGSTTNCASFIAEDPASTIYAGDTTQIGSGPSAAISTPYVVCIKYSPSTGLAAVYQNSHTASVTGQDSGDTITSLFHGSFPDGEPSSWRSRHILMYDGLLSAGDITSVMQWLGAEVGVTIS